MCGGLMLSANEWMNPNVFFFVQHEIILIKRFVLSFSLPFFFPLSSSSHLLILHFETRATTHFYDSHFQTTSNHMTEWKSHVAWCNVQILDEYSERCLLSLGTILFFFFFYWSKLPWRMRKQNRKKKKEVYFVFLYNAIIVSIPNSAPIRITRSLLDRYRGMGFM